MLKEHGIVYTYIQADKKLFGKVMMKTGLKTVPQVFMDGELIGGYDELKNKLEGGQTA